MIVPPVGGLGSLTGGLSFPQPTATPAKAALAGAEATAPVEGASPAEATTPSEGAGGTSFGSSLTEAISSLEKTQESSDSAARALATGTAKDPESAVVTVENAQMAMDLASQLRTKATEAAQSIFQTQV